MSEYKKYLANKLKNFYVFYKKKQNTCLVKAYKFFCF